MATTKKKASSKKKRTSKKVASKPLQVMLNRRELAYLFGLSDRQIGRLAKEDLPLESKNAGRGGWRVDGRVAIEWWVRRKLQKELPQSDELTFNSERLRLTTEQADEKAIANAEKRGELIRTEHVAEFTMEAVARLAGELSGLPGRVANELAGTTDPATCRHIVKRETDRIRAAFADRLRESGESREVHIASRGDH